MNVDRKSKEYQEIIKEELHIKAPMWLNLLIKALGTEKPFYSEHITFENKETVERATIRLALVCQAFEEMLELRPGGILDNIAEIYPSVSATQRDMAVAAGFHWEDSLENA